MVMVVQEMPSELYAPVPVGPLTPTNRFRPGLYTTWYSGIGAVLVTHVTASALVMYVVDPVDAPPLHARKIVPDHRMFWFHATSAPGGVVVEVQVSAPSVLVMIRLPVPLDPEIPTQRPRDAAYVAPVHADCTTAGVGRRLHSAPVDETMTSAHTPEELTATKRPSSGAYVTSDQA